LLDEVLDLHDERGLLGYGKVAKFTYDNYLGYGKWEEYALLELSLL
jgi:hypothetical protein